MSDERLQHRACRHNPLASPSTRHLHGSPLRQITQREVVVVDGKRVGGSTPTLYKVGVDQTKMARGGRLDAVFGRDDKIRMCLRTLGRRRKSNPCLIGEPGGSGAMSHRGILCVRDKDTNGEEGGR